MQAVILAAGKGSRLQPITAKRSKAMLPILGKPIIERVMEGLSSNGIDDFILVISPDDHQIGEHFRRTNEIEADIHFVTQPGRLGMADALLCAKPHIRGDFILTACDNLVPSNDTNNLVRMWKTYPQLDAILTLLKVSAEQVGDTGIVELHGERVINIIEKPSPEYVLSNIASLPLYYFSPKLLEFLPNVTLSTRGELEIQDAIQMLIDQGGKVRGLMVKNRHTITHPSDLLKINLYFLSAGFVEPRLQPKSVGPDTKLIGPLFVERGTIIGANCIIGPNVYIEQNCVIQDDVYVRDSVILENSVVPQNNKIINQIVSNDTWIRSTDVISF